MVRSVIYWFWDVEKEEEKEMEEEEEVLGEFNKFSFGYVGF